MEEETGNRGGRSAEWRSEGWAGEQVRVRSNYVRGRFYRVLNLITAISRRLCVPNISNYGGVLRMTNRPALDIERGCVSKLLDSAHDAR